jgi:hypothetical protein
MVSNQNSVAGALQNARAGRATVAVFIDDQDHGTNSRRTHVRKIEDVRS